jgi:hypothetical protein
VARCRISNRQQEAIWVSALNIDLTKGRSDKEVLDLRRNSGLAREIAARVVEQYAAMLNKLFSRDPRALGAIVRRSKC